MAFWSAHPEVASTLDRLLLILGEELSTLPRAPLLTREARVLVSLDLGLDHFDDQRLAARRGRSLVLTPLGAGLLLVVGLEPAARRTAVDLISVLEYVERLGGGSKS